VDNRDVPTIDTVACLSGDVCTLSYSVPVTAPKGIAGAAGSGTATAAFTESTGFVAEGGTDDGMRRGGGVGGRPPCAESDDEDVINAIVNNTMTLSTARAWSATRTREERLGIWSAELIGIARRLGRFKEETFTDNVMHGQ
jgi:hypothetical protein